MGTIVCEIILFDCFLMLFIFLLTCIQIVERATGMLNGYIIFLGLSFPLLLGQPVGFLRWGSIRSRAMFVHKV